jgi:hypothetical protein
MSEKSLNVTQLQNTSILFHSTNSKDEKKRAEAAWETIAKELKVVIEISALAIHCNLVDTRLRRSVLFNEKPSLKAF